MVQPGLALQKTYFFDAFATNKKKISQRPKAKKYPLKLFARTLPTASVLAANDVNRINVVDTGILNLVSIKRNIGAATCRKWNSVGAISNPFAANRPWLTSPSKVNQL